MNIPWGELIKSLTVIEGKYCSLLHDGRLRNDFFRNRSTNDLGAMDSVADSVSHCVSDLLLLFRVFQHAPHEDWIYQLN